MEQQLEVQVPQVSGLDAGIRSVVRPDIGETQPYVVSFTLNRDEFHELQDLIADRKIIASIKWRLSEGINVLKAAISNCKYTMVTWRNRYGYGRQDAESDLEQVRFGTVCLALDVLAGEAELGGQRKSS